MWTENFLVQDLGIPVCETNFEEGETLRKVNAKEWNSNTKKNTIMFVATLKALYFCLNRIGSAKRKFVQLSEMKNEFEN